MTRKPHVELCVQGRRSWGCCIPEAIGSPDDSGMLEGPGMLMTELGGGFTHVLFSPLFGEDFQFD